MTAPKTKKQLAQRRSMGNRVKALIIGGCTAALMVGGSLAFFTDMDQVQNDFTIADSLKIQVVEPNWNPQNAQGLAPLATVAKDPAVKNVSGVPAWMVAQVKVPVATVMVVNDQGARVEKTNAELFTYTLNTDGWTELGQPDVDGGFATHTYLAKNSVAVGGSTPNLFDQVQLINLVEGQLKGDALNQQIDVVGYGIQTEGFDSASAAWTAYQKQNAVA
ncbi:MAG: SipW-dependent-type signal peptide-containing protein [Coriobacteriia bacterium]|nr:SipW-dependent-type signal peptide-containing protein [Coriobacteriia bacterium]